MRAVLALANGTLFHGKAVGPAGQAVGEVVFNTAMTGYQEILSDPSYARQLVTLTYPHIGNTGCNENDMEAERPFAEGLIIRDASPITSNWRSTESLPDFLTRHKRPAIAEIDTRKLTRILREEGAQAGCILAAENPDPEVALAAARAFPGLEGMDVAREVTTDERYEWKEGLYDLDRDGVEVLDGERHVVAYDFGIKRNILRLLADAGARITVVPAQTPAADVLALEPDGIFLSNGPGDPEPCTYAIEAIRTFLDSGVPLFGICLGHQLLGLAAGASTRKMKFGHHGANHPVQDLETGEVFITSQNHGFAVDEDSLPANVEATHRSLFDGTLQGLRFTDRPAFGFQGHPEASPGPHDIQPLFARFRKLIDAARVPA